jgi:hypothetical protein
MMDKPAPSARIVHLGTALLKKSFIVFLWYQSSSRLSKRFIGEKRADDPSLTESQPLICTNPNAHASPNDLSEPVFTFQGTSLASLEW